MYYIRYFLFTCLVFMTLLVWKFFPSQPVALEAENRMLAGFPRLFVENKLNQNLGTEVDHYLKDYFPYRSDIIKAHFNALYAINRRVENSKAIMGDDGWMFVKSHFDVQQKKYSQKELEKISKALESINVLLKKHDIKFYVLIVPNKAFVYREYISKYMNIDKMKDTAVIVKEYLSKHNPDITVLYPSNEMYKERYNYPDPLYQKVDNHPTGWGYYILYRALMSEISKSFPSIKYRDPTEFKYVKARYDIGWEMKLIGFSEKILFIPNIEPKEKVDIKIKDDFRIYTSDKGKYKVFWVGTSMGYGVHRLMWGTFNQVIFFNDWENKDKPSHVLEHTLKEKSDIFVFDIPLESLGGKFFYERIDKIVNSYPEVK